jgi:hypothetical protein
VSSSFPKPVPLSQPLRQFWQFMWAYCAAAIGISLIHAALFGWRVGSLAFGIVLLILIGILTLGQPLFVPYRVQQWQVQPVVIDRDWPPHDWSDLEQLTAELAELGFQPLQDYAQPQRSGQFQPIARCFGNPTIGSFAEVGFCLMNAAETTTPIGARPKPPITHMVLLTVFDRGWILIDGNFAPHRRESLIYAWRNPREVRHYYPDLTPQELVDRHLGNRQAMMHRLNVQAVQNITWDTYQEIQQELITQPWRRLRRRNLLLAMIAATGFERQPSHEWLGAYRRELRQDLPPALAVDERFGGEAAIPKRVV